jgi:hypothetical protein
MVTQTLSILVRVKYIPMHVEVSTDDEAEEERQYEDQEENENEESDDGEVVSQEYSLPIVARRALKSQAIESTREHILQNVLN